MNDKVYTHEFIDIIGSNRSKYVHHMTANWSPIAQEERNQLCYGVWGTVGTTGRWPQVVNLWEEDGFDGLAAGLRHETSRPSFQDPKLEKWWLEAAGYRSGGLDRVLVPEPWTRTVSQLCADGVRGEVYAHEMVTVDRGGAKTFLARVRDEAVSAYASHGWELVGAFRTAMVDESECILIWAIPSWDQWAAFEKSLDGDGPTRRWRDRLYEVSTSAHRFLMIDAPLSPLRIGRQPARSDRAADWEE
nr:hypothetical protein [Micromonospora sp. DSM 115978]